MPVAGKSIRESVVGRRPLGNRCAAVTTFDSSPFQTGTDPSRVVTAAAGSRFQLVGLSTEATNLKQYIAEGHAPFPVYQVSSKAQMEKLGLGGTPETIVVGPGAKVEKAWRGAYMAENMKEIENFFGVKLPGLQEPVVTAAN